MTEPARDDSTAASPTTASPKARLVLNLVLYTLARLALVVVVAAIIVLIGKLAGITIPFAVVVIFALVVSLPLGMLSFKKLRIRVNTSIAEVDEQRRADRDALRAKLRGDTGGDQ